jgi:pyrroline-5-carboxylate reductase
MTIACLGSGKMGTALLRGIVSRGLCTPADIIISDPVEAARHAAADAIPGIRIAGDNHEAAATADAVLVCVKPYGVVPLLTSLQGLPPKLIISIAAGVTLADMERAAPNHRIIRVMPNTPALVGKGASAFTPGHLATEADIATTTDILGAVGTVSRVTEPLLDAVTGVSGSGPAYIYTVIEALADGGVHEGLPREEALRLAAQTVAGAAAMVLETGLHPAVLRDQVTSPGGTTIRGLAALEAGGIRSAIIRCVEAAAARARELGRPSS